MNMGEVTVKRMVGYRCRLKIQRLLGRSYLAGQTICEKGAFRNTLHG